MTLLPLLPFPPLPPLRVFVFAARRCEEAKALAAAIGGQFVARESADYGDLLLIARHGAVEPTVVVAVDAGGTTRLRLTSIPTAEALRRRLDGVACTPGGTRST